MVYLLFTLECTNIYYTNPFIQASGGFVDIIYRLHLLLCRTFRRLHTHTHRFEGWSPRRGPHHMQILPENSAIHLETSRALTGGEAEETQTRSLDDPMCQEELCFFWGGSPCFSSI